MFGRLKALVSILSLSFSHALFTSVFVFVLFFNAAVAFPILLANSSSKDSVDVMVDPKYTNLSTVFRDSPPSFISGGEFVPCPITSVFLTLIVNLKRSHASARRSISQKLDVAVCRYRSSISEEQFSNQHFSR